MGNPFPGLFFDLYKLPRIQSVYKRERKPIEKGMC